MQHDYDLHRPTMRSEHCVPIWGHCDLVSLRYEFVLLHCEFDLRHFIPIQLHFNSILGHADFIQSRFVPILLHCEFILEHFVPIQGHVGFGHSDANKNRTVSGRSLSKFMLGGRKKSVSHLPCVNTPDCPEWRQCLLHCQLASNLAAN